MKKDDEVGAAEVAAEVASGTADEGVGVGLVGVIFAAALPPTFAWNTSLLVGLLKNFIIFRFLL